MDTPYKRHKSWFSSLTGLVSGGRPSAQDDAPSSFSSSSVSKTGASNPSGDRASSRSRSSRHDEQTPVRNPGTFSAPPVDSPESPAKRGSPTLLAQRKMHDRVQGPSGRLSSTSSSNALMTSNASSGFSSYNKSTIDNHYTASGPSRFASTPRRTNFSSATTPRNMFRDSMSHGAPAFTFTPRVPLNTMRGNFPAATPGRSYRTSGIEMSAREMAKVSSSDLFPMKIPDPDTSLSGEAIAGMVPKELKAGNRSIYASEYLAHLCPPDFNEEQRNQFFCILDLRRLKYAADEVFLKKDWRLNILNFAKEYEKNRSLIMLRYGLYEFKTVKVSKDIFQKWKTANNIPDVDEEDSQGELPVGSRSSELPVSAKAGASLPSKPNGTEGILRAGKRKAQDNLDPSTTTKTSSLAPSTKRSRPTGRATDREPLTETSTPALNKSKRKATDGTPADSLHGEKTQKPATPSATKSLFEKMANSTTKDDSAPTPTATPFAANPLFGSNSTAKPSLFKSSTMNQLPKPSNSSNLARSVLENGLKSSATTNNIFAHLSDAGSAKNSTNGNEDSEESDADNDAEEERATEKESTVTADKVPTLSSSSSLFSAKPAVSPSSSEPAPSKSASTQDPEALSGRSLFERVNKNSDGQPIRMFGSGNASASLSTPAPIFGSKPTSERASPEKEATPSLFSANKTWTTDSPIKFASANSTAPAPPKALFGAAPTPDTLTPNDTERAAVTSTPFKFGSSTVSSGEALSTPGVAFPVKQVDAQSSTPALFGFANNKPAASSSTDTTSETTSIFNKPGGASTPAASLFGKAQGTEKQESNSSMTSTTPAAPAPPSFQPGALFGTAANPSTSSAGLKRSADDDAAQPSAKSTFPSLNSVSSPFGNVGKSSASADEPNAKRPLFGGGLGSGPVTETAPAAPAQLFSFSAPKENGEAKKDNPLQAPVFEKTAVASPLFSTNISGAGTATEPPKASALFGGTAPVTTSGSTNTLFSFGGENNKNGSTPAVQPSTSTPLFSFGSSSNPVQQTGAAPTQTSFTSTPSFTGGNGTSSAGSSFTFNIGGGTKPFNNPFASTGGASSTPGFGAGVTNGNQPDSSTSFQFGGDSAAPKPLFSFGGGASQPSSTQNGNSFENNISGNESGASPMFSFGAGAPAQTNSMALFGQQKPVSSTPLFNLAPPLGGASTGTNTPLTNLGGASSLATTPATNTPEPGATQDNADNSGHQADGDEASQVQLNLAEGVSGEEDEDVVHEVRTKVLRLVPPKEGTDGDESSATAAATKKSPWKTEGVGPLRVLKHKATGAVRLLLRGEPRGHVVLNRALLPNFTYKPDPNAKYVKLTTGDNSGNGLETWMLQVKTKEAAQALGSALEEHKLANKK